MDPFLLMTIEVVITAVMSVEVYKLHCLSRSGALASMGIGVVLAVFGSVNAFFLMSLFTIVSFFATMRDIDKKIDMGLQEGEFGERGWKNVVAVGLPPCLFTVLYYFIDMSETLYVIAFVSSVAVAGADTIASEIGVKDPKTYMITNLKPVEPGTNGGISKLGTAVSTLAALAIAVIGWITMTGSLDVLLIIPFLMGVFGNFLDSVFGAVLENKGYMSKYTNNCSTEFIAALLGAGIYLLIA